MSLGNNEATGAHVQGENGMSDYTDGQWIATTMGQFIQILVDSGHDPCIIFRVEEDKYPDGEESSFVRKMTVYSVPDGSVVDMLRELGMTGEGHYGIYKVLGQLIQAELVT